MHTDSIICTLGDAYFYTGRSEKRAPVFAARCYASAAYAVMWCLSVCLSVICMRGNMPVPNTLTTVDNADLDEYQAIQLTACTHTYPVFRTTRRPLYVSVVTMTNDPALGLRRPGSISSSIAEAGLLIKHDSEVWSQMIAASTAARAHKSVVPVWSSLI